MMADDDLAFQKWLANELIAAKDSELELLRDIRDDYAELRAAIEALCVESEQVRRSSRVLPGVEPMVYVSDIRALLADDGAAALREHDEQLGERIAQTVTNYCERELLPASAYDLADVVRAAASVRTAGEAGDGD